MPYDAVIANRKSAETEWQNGTRPWSECLKSAHGPLNTLEKLDPSDPMTPAYMRVGMSDVERAITLAPVVTVLFGSKEGANGTAG